MSTFHLVAGNQQRMSLGNIKRSRSAKPFAHPVNLFCVRRTFNRYLSDSLTHVSSKSHLERTIAFPGNLWTSVSEIYKRQYKSSYTKMMTIQILHTSKALRVTRSKGAPNIGEHHEASSVAPRHISYGTVSGFVQNQGQFLKRQSKISGQFLPNSSPKSRALEHCVFPPVSKKELGTTIKHMGKTYLSPKGASFTKFYDCRMTFGSHDIYKWITVVKNLLNIISKKRNFRAWNNNKRVLR